MSLTVWQITIAVLIGVLVFDLALAIIRRNKETMNGVTPKLEMNFLQVG